MARGRRARTAGLAAAGLLAAGAVAPPAAADEQEPLFLGWTSALPPEVGTYERSSGDACRAGNPQCLDRTLARMNRHLDELAVTCDHDAVFAMTYLRTTEEFGRAVETPGFFQDPSFLHHWDAVFAGYYERAYADWHSGDRDTVPPAWRVAFAAADEQRVSGSGNLLLGMSAHVNRDLPFVLASIGMTAPDGTSRKTDHDKVNEFLNNVADDIPREAAARFDPAMDDTMAPFELTATTFMQLLVGWREAAWRNAERLLAAPDEQARAEVAADIERDAEAVAEGIVAVTSYEPPLTGPQQRNDWCAVHGAS